MPSRGGQLCASHQPRLEGKWEQWAIEECRFFLAKFGRVFTLKVPCSALFSLPTTVESGYHNVLTTGKYNFAAIQVYCDWPILLGILSIAIFRCKSSLPCGTVAYYGNNNGSWWRR
jgi:hypothetical protein